MRRAPSDGGEDLGELGLADAGLALEEQRAAELERQEDGRRERSVGDVVAATEVVLDRLDGAGAGGAASRGRLIEANLHWAPASAIGRVELARVGREAEPLAAGQDPAVAELGDGPLGRAARPTAGAAGAGRRRSPSSTRRRSAGRGSRSRRCAPARASSPGGPGTPRRTTRPPSAAIATKKASSGSVLAAPAVRIRSTGSGRRTKRGHRGLDSLGVVLDVVDRLRSSEPRPSTLARTLASNRSRAIPRTDSLTMTPTRLGRNGATQTSG